MNDQEVPLPTLSELAALASNFQSLCNIAEVKAPGLVDDAQWREAKARLDQEATRIGVDAWVEHWAQEQLRYLEESEDEDEYEEIAPGDRIIMQMKEID